MRNRHDQVRQLPRVAEPACFRTNGAGLTGRWHTRSVQGGAFEDAATSEAKQTDFLVEVHVGGVVGRN